MANQIFNIKVTKKGRPITAFIKTVEQAFSKERTYRDLEKIKRTVLEDLNLYVNANRQRKSEVHDERWRETARNNLVNAISKGTEVISTGNKHQLGIGKISYLKKHAPYWAIINYGGKIRSGVIFGKFDKTFPKPMSSLVGGDQTFKFLGGGIKGTKYLLEPKTPIPPMYYLNRMAQIFETEILLLQADYVRRLKARTM